MMIIEGVHGEISAWLCPWDAGVQHTGPSDGVVEIHSRRVGRPKQTPLETRNTPETLPRELTWLMGGPSVYPRIFH